MPDNRSLFPLYIPSKGRAEYMMTSKALAKMVLDLTGSTSSLVFKPLPADDPKQRKPDASLALGMLGWSAKTSLEDGLRTTIKYFRGQNLAEHHRKGER